MFAEFEIWAYIVVYRQDLTAHLNKEKYFASYNRPFFRNINEKSMYAKYTSDHGVMFSYKDNPRAKIFERDQPKVRSLYYLRRVARCFAICLLNQCSHRFVAIARLPAWTL